MAGLGAGALLGAEEENWQALSARARSSRIGRKTRDEQLFFMAVQG